VVDTSSILNYSSFEVSQSTPGNFNEQVQTFTVGLTGNLDQVNVEVSEFYTPDSSTGPLTLEIWTYNGNTLISEIASAPAVSFTTVSTNAGTFVEFDLTNGLSVIRTRMVPA
jgi:hypothetical protein